MYMYSSMYSRWSSAHTCSSITAKVCGALSVNHIFDPSRGHFDSLGQTKHNFKAINFNIGLLKMLSWATPIHWRTDSYGYMHEDTFSSVASPFCHKGQNERIFPIFALFSPDFSSFFPIFSWFFLIFGNFFRCQGWHPAPILATPLDTLTDRVITRMENSFLPDD